MASKLLRSGREQICPSICFLAATGLVANSCTSFNRKCDMNNVLARKIYIGNQVVSRVVFTY